MLPARSSIWLRRCIPLLTWGLLVGALWLLQRQMRAYDYRQILSALRSIPRNGILLAIALTFLNYAVLTGYDYLGCLFIQHAMRYRRIAMASIIGYAFSHMGSAFISGGSIRLRLYSAWGLSALQITQLVAFGLLTFGLGAMALCGLTCLFRPEMSAHLFNLPPGAMRPLGMAIIAALVLYLIIYCGRRRPVKFKGVEIPSPSRKLGAAQIALAALDICLCAGVLYALLPAGAKIGFVTFAGVFAISFSAGFISQSPGGLGVFDGFLMTFLAGKAPAPELLAALLLYRIIYYFIPLLAGTLLLGGHEVMASRRALAGAAENLGQWFPGFVPQSLGLSVFFCGAGLVFSRAFPIEDFNLQWTSNCLGLWMVEASNMLTGLMGVALIDLSRSIERRRQFAWRFALLCLACGAVLTLIAGAQWEISLSLVAVWMALRSAKRHFDRTAMGGAPRPSTRSSLIILGLLTISWGAGFFTNSQIDWSFREWFRISLDADWPRFMRAMSLVSIAAISLEGFRRMISARLRPRPPLPHEIAEAREILEAAPSLENPIALAGGHCLLFSQDRKAYLAFAKHGRLWIARGDPTGPPLQQTDVIWRFRELCAEAGAYPIFWAVKSHNLPTYLDLGWTSLEIANRGLLPLDSFSIHQSVSPQEIARVEEFRSRGGRCAVIDPGSIKSALPELRAAAFNWLSAAPLEASVSTSSSNGQLPHGFYSDDYLARGLTAVLYEGVKIKAFSTLSANGRSKEIALDCIHKPAGLEPRETISLFLLEIIKWAGERGFEWVDLGMIPSAEPECKMLRQAWEEKPAGVYPLGVRFEDYPGARELRESLSLISEPRHLICPAEFNLNRILSQIADILRQNSNL